MKAGSYYARNGKFKNLNDQLVIKYDGRTVSTLWERAEAERALLAEKYRGLPGAQRRHVNAIISYIAVYRVLKAESPDDALELVAEQSKATAQQRRKSMLRLSNSFPGLFVRACRVVSASLFGERAGFKRAVIPAGRGECRFDILACPYVQVCAENGCPELAPVFCDADVYAYSHLPRVEFRRTRTIAGGAASCDFYYGVRDTGGRR